MYIFNDPLSHDDDLKEKTRYVCGYFTLCWLVMVICLNLLTFSAGTSPVCTYVPVCMLHAGKLDL